VLLTGAALEETAVADRLTRLQARGCKVVCLPADDDGATGRRLNLRAVCEWLAEQGCNEVQVEAGARLTGAFLAHGLVDEWLLYQAPVVLGEGLGLAEPLAVLAQPGDAPRWRLHDLARLGDGIRLVMRPPAAP
jgi:diaminohydroxyphosphoribosylaminopyrimidine deaminase/5-amino-6-(5-phosphoribosylamino)uracil reductase